MTSRNRGVINARVLRFVLALSIACAVASFPAAPETCVDQCADDSDDGRCAPACTDCGCCLMHIQLSVTSLVAKEWPYPEMPRFDVARLVAPAAPEPDDILHVPIALNA